MQSILVYTHALPAGIQHRFKKAIINYSELGRVPYGIISFQARSHRSSNFRERLAMMPRKLGMGWSLMCITRILYESEISLMFRVK